MVSRGVLARTIVAGAFAGFLAATLPAAPLDCEKLKVSVLPEPPGYAAQCLGEPEAVRGPAAPQVPKIADQAFFLNLRSGGTFGQQLLKAFFPSLIFTSLGPQALPIFAMEWDPLTATTLYGIDNASRNLGTINTTNGVFTPMTAVTGVSGDTISGMAIDPTNGTAYIVATAGSPATIANLYTLNLATGAATLAGPITGYPAIVDIAISNFGVMYAHDVGGDRIVRVDKATGAGTDVGATGYNANFAQGMSFDRTTNTLWISGYLGGGQSRLAKINLATGTATTVASTSNEELELEIQEAFQEIAIPIVTEGLFLEIFADAGARYQDILVPNEDSYVRMDWGNVGGEEVPAGPGVINFFGGPFGPAYTIIDGNGSHPTIAPGAAESCTDCYQVRVSGNRPAQHFDAGIGQVLTTPGVSQGIDFHIGGSFADVLRTNPFYFFIERTFHHQVTAGCAPNLYCPDDAVTREQMAVFTMAAKYPGVVPPACAPPNVFGDVPETSPYCPFIESAYDRGVVVGCGGGNFCPGSPVLREQMPVFILRTQFGQDYYPPPCTSQIFFDVPTTSPYCPSITDAYLRGITAGCGGGEYCADSPITRGQMSVFMKIILERRFEDLPRLPR